MLYDYDYFERGIETGKSNYQNYRWIPELTIPMAMTIIDLLGIKPGDLILDYGCAKGYLVKALRMLNREAWGCDISGYALMEADADVQPFSSNLNRPDKFLYITKRFKYGICKDVLEHIPVDKLSDLLRVLNVETLFTIVPLGHNGKYYASANNLDVTHVICENETWWLNLLHNCNWKCHYFSTRVKGIKDTYEDIPNSHLFMIHRRK